MDETHRRFYEDLAQSLDMWVEETVGAVTDADWDLVSWESARDAIGVLRDITWTRDQKEALRAVLLTAMAGLLHSVAVTLDNGTEMADHFTVRVVASNGEELGPNHELLFRHLFETGRLR